jgi:hypothetical protein
MAVTKGLTDKNSKANTRSKKNMEVSIMEIITDMSLSKKEPLQTKQKFIDIRTADQVLQADELDNSKKTEYPQFRPVVIWEELLQKAATQLKTEFYGIDEQIDQIIENTRPFFMSNGNITRPIIINLWGMTGVGKTEVLRRFFQLLDVMQISSFIDMGEAKTYELRDEFSSIEEAIKKYGMGIVVLDEMQLFRTKDERGGEKDSIARPIWSLLDGGIVPVLNTPSNNIYKLISHLITYEGKEHSTGLSSESKSFIQNEIFEVNYEIPVTLNNSLKINASNFLDLLQKVIDIKYNIDLDDLIYRFNNAAKAYIKYFDILENLKKSKKKPQDSDWEEITHEWGKNVLGLAKTLSKPVIAKQYWIAPVRLVMSYMHGCIQSGINLLEEYYTELNEIKTLQMPELLERVYKTASNSALSTKQIDLTRTIIFVLGNIDEAYPMAGDMSPDIDADFYNKLSKKINILHIKEALSRRFRAEQIARLGNNHIIYPSLPKEAYMRFIKKEVQKRIDEISIWSGYPIILKSPHKIWNWIYSEAVIPTQGIRPLLSSLSTMVDSYLQWAVTKANISCKQPVTQLIWEIDDKWAYFDTNQGMILKKELSLNFTNIRLDYTKDTRDIVLVHEAGHMVMSVFTNKIPEFVSICMADLSSLGVNAFIDDNKIKDITYIINEVLISSAGAAAEEIVYGKYCSGCSGDFNYINKLITTALLKYGYFRDHINPTIYENEANGFNLSPIDSECIDIIKTVSNNLMQACIKILKDYKKYLVIGCQMLSEKDSVDKEYIITNLVNSISSEDLKSINNSLYQVYQTIGYVKSVQPRSEVLTNFLQQVF